MTETRARNWFQYSPNERPEGVDPARWAAIVRALTGNPLPEANDASTDKSADTAHSA